MIYIDPVNKTAFYRVEDAYDCVYEVEILKYNSPDLRVKCPCYERGLCRHGYAALLHFRSLAGKLEEHIASQKPLESISIEDYANGLWRHRLTDTIWSEAVDLVHEGKVKLCHSESNKVELVVHSKGKDLQVKFQKNGDNLKFTCECGNRYILCQHTIAALVQMMDTFGPNAFDLIENFQANKEGILKQYGLSTEDPESDLFQFTHHKGQFTAILKDPGLMRLNEFEPWRAKAELFLQPKIPVTIWRKRSKEMKIAYVWNFQNYQGIKFICPVFGKIKKDGAIGGVIREYTKYSVDLIELDDADQRILEFTNELDTKTRNNYDNIETQREVYYELCKISQLFDHKENYLHTGDSGELKMSGLSPIDIDPEMPNVEFVVSQNNFIELQPYIIQNDIRRPFSEYQPVWYGILLSPEGKLLLLRPAHAQALAFFYNNNGIKVNARDWDLFSEDFLMPLSEKCVVNYDEKMKTKEIPSKSATPEKRIYFSELDTFFLLTPTFFYHDDQDHKEVEMDKGESVLLNQNGARMRILRNKEFEAEAELFIRKLHPGFEKQQNQRFFHLPIREVLDSGWFFHCFEQLQKRGFEVYGLKNLQKISYSPHRPKVIIRAGSGIDWFDLKVKVSFGDQEVKLADIRKALFNREKYVKLNSGQLGMLPDDWIEKYSSLFKATTAKKGNLQLNKYQYALIDGYVEEIENNKVFVELAEKIHKLRHIDEIPKVEPPHNIKAIPRHYQVSGYQWLTFLNDINWGGCLADDMGLGKTLQVLMLLQKLVNDNPAFAALVVVPRSLVFNWKKEIEKFTPELNILSYAETNRTANIEDFKNYHIVISTYGLVRSDIAKLRQFEFDYVILDESQAIKNPAAQISKAVKLLKAKNRLVLTGTPIENNTFDLYSQMDFLNPGMLGSVETFRKEYANRIDKEKDVKAAAGLRRLVYPFMLSRKKGEVAKELPDKSETVIYCEMDTEQRKVYDYFKKDYAEKALQMIEDEGLNKAGIYILQGLLKLRQICNSPQLLGDGDYGKSSVKLDILREEIPTITGRGEKVLIFSFFVEMLDLIKKELEILDIGYEILTGGSVNREKIVERFKTNDEARVFLISLKAGGFGLNLTEANYVFLADPWWNPAVEQQAFDRTHRIGQTRKVFTYKLICKDTIEEKIMLLQEKKKMVAKEIITVDQGFFKNLKKEDVQDLFR